MAEPDDSRFTEDGEGLILRYPDGRIVQIRDGKEVPITEQQIERLRQQVEQ